MGGAIQKPTGFEITARAFASKRRSLALALATSLAVLSLGGVAGASHNLTRHLSLGEPKTDGAVGSIWVGASADGSRVFFRTLDSLVSADTDASADIYERSGVVTTLVTAGLINGNGAFGAEFRDASADGSRVLFRSAEKLVSADTDSSEDLYQRSGGITILISAGQINGNGAFDAEFRRASDDGSRVLFETNEKLVSTDTDASKDVYERSAGTTTRVSAGQINGNGAFDAVFLDASEDGSRVIFSTAEKLVAADTDASKDIYERSGGTTTRISAGQINGNGAFDAFGGCAMPVDGAQVFFSTAEKLVSADTDSSPDLYQRSGGTTTLISAGEINGNGAFDANLDCRTSADGTRVFFVTEEKLVSADTDSRKDVYERTGGTTTLISAGEINGNGAIHAGLWEVSPDGDRVVFQSTEALVSADTDPSRFDAYERSGGTTRLVTGGTVAGAVAGDAFVQGNSDDLTRVFFETPERLVAADTDSSMDLYEGSGGVTTLVSAGQINGNGAFLADFAGASPDGSRVYINTQEPLVPEDTDTTFDVYERSAGATTMVSVGEPLGNGAFAATFRGASGDGTKVFFSTAEPLASADTDASTDVYQRSGSITTRISSGQVNGNGAFTATFAGAAADGSHVFFTTSERLVSGDTDSSSDVYERSGATTARVSAGQINGNGAFTASFRGASTDGTKVFFSTTEALVSTDTDTSTDVYKRAGGSTTRVSAGAINGNGAFGATFAGVSANGSRLFFTTAEPLVAADTDTSQDVYQRDGTTTTLVSAGQINGNGAFGASFRGASADGSRVFFTTAEPLVAADSDTRIDVYERSGGTTTRVSAGQVNGNGAFDVFFAGASTDGSRVYFESFEPLVGTDTDTRQDVYERSGGTTRLRSAGQINGNGSFSATFTGASADGARIFFRTNEPLVAADTDSAFDIYERADGTTRLVSAGQTNGNGAVDAFFAGASADGTRIFFESDEQLATTDTDSATDIYERASGVTSLVSTGAGAFDVSDTIGTSTSGSAVFYSTTEKLRSSDTDASRDVYGAFIVQVE